MKTILIVDDNDVLRNRMKRGFARLGFTVYTAAGYEEAMQTIGKNCPTRAVVDLKMPGKSGLALIRDALKQAPDLRVVVLTGYGSIATATDAIRLGAVSYLAKPADIDEILQTFQKENEYEVGEHEFSPPTLPRVEWEHIQRVLNDCNGNISAAARKLDIHRRTLQRKLFKYAPLEKNKQN